MPFGLCNVLATFQRCMMTSFSDMVEDIIQIFIDDFFGFGDSFTIEVDKAKEEIIAKLPLPTNVKGIRSFRSCGIL